MHAQIVSNFTTLHYTTLRTHTPCRKIDSYLGSCLAPVISDTLPIMSDRIKEAFEPTYTKLPVEIKEE